MSNVLDDRDPRGESWERPDGAGSGAAGRYRAENAHEGHARRVMSLVQSLGERPRGGGADRSRLPSAQGAYAAIDRLKSSEAKSAGQEPTHVRAPSERRRYLSGTVDEEFEELLAAVRDAYSGHLPTRGFRGDGEAWRGTCAGTRRGER